MIGDFLKKYYMSFPLYILIYYFGIHLWIILIHGAIFMIPSGYVKIAIENGHL